MPCAFKLEYVCPRGYAGPGVSEVIKDLRGNRKNGRVEFWYRMVTFRMIIIT